MLASNKRVAEHRMKCHLYDAAGNRILWLDSRGGEGINLKSTGYELSRRFQLGQDLTAVLFGSPRALQALFWNPDGTFEMTCGNAIRCLAHFVCEDSTRCELVSVETPCATYLSRKVDATHASVIIPAQTVRVSVLELDGDFFVDVGTPHRLRLVEQEWLERDIADAIAYSTGPRPVNFSLVRKLAPFQYRVRTFERGVGETCSCGTAATSIVAALEVSGSPAGIRRSHQVEFASGERLTVIYDPSLQSYETGGRVALLQDLTV